MTKVKIPYYHQAIDWKEFTKEYPPPVEFEKTIYRWSRDKIEKLKEQKFKKVVEFATDDPLNVKEIKAAITMAGFRCA